MRINHWKQTNNWAVLDTETTGMSARDEVIELTLLSAQGDTVFNSLVKPTVPIHFMAAKTHGISEDDLTNAPTWPEVFSEFERAVYQFDFILIFNKAFDVRLINQTYKAHGMMPPKINTECVMEAFKEYLYATGSARKSKMSLDAACETIGVDIAKVDRHRSLGDCILTRDLILSTPFVKSKSEYTVSAQKEVTQNGTIVQSSESYSIKNIVEYHAARSKSMTELHLSLRDVGVELVLTGPKIEDKNFSGIVFYQGNNRVSGSQIGKNFSFNKLVSGGVVYLKENFEYFYKIFLNKLIEQQANETNIIASFAPEIRELTADSNTPLKTVFRLSVDYYFDHLAIRFVYQNGVADNLHSQTNLYPDKGPQLQLCEIRVAGREEHLKLSYKTIFDKKPIEVKAITSNTVKNYSGENNFSTATRSIFDKYLSDLIKFCLNSSSAPAQTTLKQFIFKSDKTKHICIDRDINSFVSSTYQAAVALKK